MYVWRKNTVADLKFYIDEGLEFYVYTFNILIWTKKAQKIVAERLDG